MDAGMTTLPITWKRLVKDGQTCQRCGSTQRIACVLHDEVRLSLTAGTGDARRNRGRSASARR